MVMSNPKMNDNGLVVAHSLTCNFRAYNGSCLLNPSAAPVTVSKNVSMGTVKPVGLLEGRDNLVEERVEKMLEKAIILVD